MSRWAQATRLRYASRRLVQLLPMVLAVVVCNFLLLRLIPGDIVSVIAGESGAGNPEYMAQLRAQFGLDLPWWQQLLNYLWNVAHLDFGFSYRNGVPVTELILSRLPATVALMLSAITVAMLIGVGLGVLASRYRGTIVDTVVSVFALLGFATPLFWVGLMLIVAFSINLRWLPSSGMSTIEGGISGLRYVADVAVHMILPTVTMALFYVAIYTRLLKAAMLEIYGLDYVRTARAKGISAGRIAIRHVLRNALLPAVTMTGLLVGSMLGGSVLVETVFAWPGLGRLAYEAVNQRDYNLLLGILFFSAVLVMIMNLVVDLIYSVLDPRIEVR